MWRGLLLVLAVSITLVGAEQSTLAKSEVVDDGGRFMLAVDGKKVFVKGVMWRPPASFDEDPAAFWKQSEEAIEAFFAVEAPLLKQAGVNTLRFGTTPPLQWVDALHERFGLYSMLAATILDEADIRWREAMVGGGIATVAAAVMAGFGVAALAPRMLPAQAVNVGPQLALPVLPELPVVLHARGKGRRLDRWVNALGQIFGPRG